MAAKRGKEEAHQVRFPALRSAVKPVVKREEIGALPAGLQDVGVRVSLEWGRSQITVAEALKLGAGGLVRLDQLAKEPVDVRVNGKLFARGKLVVVGDHYGVQLTELVDSD